MNYYGNGGGGNQMQMMSSVMMSCACMGLLSVGVYLGKDTLLGLVAGTDETPTPTPTVPPVVEGVEVGGKMRIKNGGVTMVTDKGTCKNTGIYFQNAKENDRDVWNLIPVPGKENVYYIQSENRLFRKGSCPGYVTANSLCNKVSMGKAGWADRQYWEPVQTGDGYMLRNVACKNKRKADYLTSSGTTSSKKKNPAKLNARAGSMYTLESVQFN